MSYLKIKETLLFGLVAMSLLFTACGGDDDEGCSLELNLPDTSTSSLFAAEEGIIDDYLLENNLQAVRTPSGLRFIVTEDILGLPDRPTLCSEVNVDYVGYYLSGEEFDSGTSISFGLSRVIDGWKEGIALFGEGTTGTIIFPSYLGYGNNPPPGIRTNAILAFDVTLNSF